MVEWSDHGSPVDMCILGENLNRVSDKVWVMKATLEHCFGLSF